MVQMIEGSYAVLLVFGIAIFALLWRSVRLFARKKSASSTLQLAGASCLVIVVLTHVAEAFQLLPAVGWGLPHSPGHYLDLLSALLGLTLFPLGLVLDLRTRRRVR